MNTEHKNKSFNVGKVRLTMHPGGQPKGFVLKREPTVRETMRILQSILGFNNNDYKDWFESKEEVEDYRAECQRALTNFLKGDADWEHLCNETQCYDDDNMGFPFQNAFPLVIYLKNKNII